MRKHKRLKGEEGLELPEEIIQHIHSFMQREQAAQTLSLSKSWYKAWSTRPNLEFYNSDFSKFCVTTLVQPYLDRNINLNKLDLHMEYYNAPHADKLIIDASKLRVNVLDLSFWNWKGSYNPPYVLPAQVFANKYLKETKLSYCKIDYLIPENVLCSNLRSLSLYRVFIEDSTFKDILVACPVVEHLNLCLDLVGLTRINASELLNLKTLVVEFSALGSSTITPSVICGRFLNLSHLVLGYVNVADSFFTNISSGFPKLEDLTLGHINYYSPDTHSSIQISSNSIAVLSLEHRGRLKMAKFDVPNIRNFKFSGKDIPPLSFTASSKEWSSEITLSSDGLDLLKLREFLMKLGRSKITLHLYGFDHDKNVAPQRNIIENFNLPAVEELTFNMESCKEYNFYLECLFCCRPKLVSLHFCSDYGPDTISIQFLYKKLIERLDRDGFSTSTQNSSSLCINELEEVNMELFEESRKQWQPIKPSDDLKIPKDGADKLRFKLKWRSLSSEYTVIKLIQYHHEDYHDEDSDCHDEDSD